ncbi:MAG: dihydrofolate reductase [Rhodocyclaceae bacterium]
MISLIAAVAQNRAIGKDNQLLWHLPDDLRYFRETTRGKAVIMGRKTWESLPAAFRPLPGRHNIVVTRDRQYVAGGATLAHSLPEAIAAADGGGETFVIGGAELYRQALPLAERLYLTEVAQAVEGDAFFPEIPAAQWQEISRAPRHDASGLEFAFVVYRRR